MSRIEPISRFERLARDLVEGTFNRILGERTITSEIARQLSLSMENSLHDNLIANIYRITLYQEDLDKIILDSPRLSEQLSDYVSQVAEETQLILAGPPVVELLSSPELGPQQVRILAEHSQQSSDTVTAAVTAMLSEAPHSPIADVTLLDAFLIVNGRRHFPLRQPVVTIGRQLDNDIVLEESSVSRKHAQLRWQYSRFVVYDLGSKSGTLVNGQPITECVLKTGDVLMLGTVPLIYGHEERPPRPAEEKRIGEDGSTLALPADDQK